MVRPCYKDGREQIPENRPGKQPTRLKTNREDHLRDGETVGNLPLRKRRKGNVRINRSTDLQEMVEEEEEEEEEEEVFLPV